jgi:hypothetical protein
LGQERADEEDDDEQEAETASEHRHYFDQLIKAYSLI